MKIERTSDKVEGFARLTTAYQRVELALDVIARIEARQFRPAFAVYAEVDYTVNPADPDGMLMTECCVVCALGALALCMFDGDALGTNGSWMRRAFSAAGIFTHEQLMLIEAAYEGWSGIRAEDEHEASTHCGWNFCDDRGDNPNERLRLVMQNLIDHEGTFNPAVFPGAQPR